MPSKISLENAYPDLGEKSVFSYEEFMPQQPSEDLNIVDQKSSDKVSEEMKFQEQKQWGQVLNQIEQQSERLDDSILIRPSVSSGMSQVLIVPEKKDPIEKQPEPKIIKKPIVHNYQPVVQDYKPSV